VANQVQGSLTIAAAVAFATYMFWFHIATRAASLSFPSFLRLPGNRSLRLLLPVSSSLQINRSSSSAGAAVATSVAKRSDLPIGLAFGRWYGK